MSSRVYLLFPPRGHEPSPTLRDKLNPQLYLQCRCLPTPRYAKRLDVALYAIGPLFLVSTPSSPHCTLKVSEHDSFCHSRPPLIQMSAFVHKSLVAYNVGIVQPLGGGDSMIPSRGCHQNSPSREQDYMTPTRSASLVSIDLLSQGVWSSMSPGEDIFAPSPHKTGEKSTISPPHSLKDSLPQCSHTGLSRGHGCTRSFDGLVSYAVPR